MIATRSLPRLSINTMLLVLLIIVVLLAATAERSKALTIPYIIVRDRSEETGTDYKELTVVCPVGMEAISGGAGIYYDSEEDVHLRPTLISSFMYPNDASWFAEAIQSENADSTWSLEVHVTCVSDGTELLKA